MGVEGNTRGQLHPAHFQGSVRRLLTVQEPGPLPISDKEMKKREAVQMSHLSFYVHRHTCWPVN